MDSTSSTVNQEKEQLANQLVTVRKQKDKLVRQLDDTEAKSSDAITFYNRALLSLSEMLKGDENAFLNDPINNFKKLVKKGGKLHDKYCEKCHSDGGQSAEDDSGILAGQWTDYLKWSLADYTSGNREMTKKMAKKLKKLVKKEGDKGIDALLAYYASQQ